MGRRWYSTGRFAKRASVSVRTLRFYDRAGLLVPSERTEAGYRIYTDEDFPRLQQVLALKFLGLSLDEIKRCLVAGPGRLQESLGRQKAMMREKREQLDAVLQAIGEAEQLLAAEPAEPAGSTASAFEAVVRVIEVIQMQQQSDWVNKYLSPEQQEQMRQLSEQSYSEEAREKLAARGPWTEEDQQRASRQWAEVGAELKRLVAAGADPAGPEAQTWADSFNALISAFTQNDPEIEAGLQTWWKRHNDLPPEQQPMQTLYTPEERAFMNQALAAARER
ncbi:MAG: MerR family transcriptional regulator [Chloroflexota bacterium]